ncbi:DcaP family trimeric outer membrane transporter [uncultured Psychrosphaera sp.]|uniref:DcaP family trimeric outer membrane transporter n=1 Tax=uncultured Psychrosphaera sp. TaxID=1403522 RepID=UPI00260F2920|nr:DcaP family trimeric outer membrane transporter [uncultured Psychrosphaera sp.]
MKKIINVLTSATILSTTVLFSGASTAAYEIKVNDDETIKFGGFIKVDGRHVTGNVAYQDFWIGTGTVLTEDASQTKFSVRESRINTTYTGYGVTAFIEMDFYGSGGNEVISNSSNPRLRHAMIKYEDFVIGQTWTTFMNTSALAETVDFAGAMVGEAFVRNTQVRYSKNGFSVALENPESYGGDPTNDSMPDIIAKYQFKGDWGNVSVAALVRQLTTLTGETESAAGVSIAGKINVASKDDFRFQLHQGNLGRYVGVAAATDLVGEEVEESSSFMVAYRHFWTEAVRSSVFYGNITTTESDVDRSHWGVNIFKNYTPKFSVGAEIGNFEMAEADADSSYMQVSAKLAF